jgi:hypothetical protein
MLSCSWTWDVVVDVHVLVNVDGFEKLCQKNKNLPTCYTEDTELAGADPLLPQLSQSRAWLKHRGTIQNTKRKFN